MRIELCLLHEMCAPDDCQARSWGAARPVWDSRHPWLGARQFIFAEKIPTVNGRNYLPQNTRCTEGGSAFRGSFLRMAGVWNSGLFIGPTGQAPRPFAYPPLLLLVATATVAIISLTGIVRGLRGDPPKVLASVLCAPVLTLALFGGLLKFHIDPDWIRFQIVRPWYLKQIAKSPESSPKHHQWNWGETGSAIGPNFFHRLVYDESDAPSEGSPRRRS